MAALLWRQRRRVQQELETALFGGRPGSGTDSSLRARLEAIAALEELASPPSASPEAEDALHRILREAPTYGEEGEEAQATSASLRNRAEEALWGCWHRSGDEELDEAIKKGMSLMERERFDEAIAVFTELITQAPLFAEAWNKRATALYMAGEYARSIEDCAKVLELKPRHFGCLSGLGMCHRAKGNDAESLKWLRKSLLVHPGMQGPQRIVLNAVVQERLTPLISNVVEAFRRNSRAEESSDDLTCTWDVHRVTPDGPEAASPHIYFFRVGFQNRTDAPHAIKSLARYYVLHFENGHVFPFTRLTEGSSSFTLKPGGEYKFCWALIVSRPLQGMAGGVLLERLDGSQEPNTGGWGKNFDEAGYPRTSLAPLLEPHLAPEVAMSELQRLGRGHYYTGQLDLRQVAGL